MCRKMYYYNTRFGVSSVHKHCLIKSRLLFNFLLRKQKITFLFIEILSLEQKHTFPSDYSRYLFYCETQLHTPPLNLNPRTALLYFYRPFQTSACCSISWLKVHDPSISLSELLFSTLPVSYVQSIILKFFPTFHSTASLLFSLETWMFSRSQVWSQFSNMKQQR